MERILVAGLGSMGTRRVRLLQKLRPEIQIYGVDASNERRDKAEKTRGISTYASLERALEAERYDAAVISTPPLTHAGMIRGCLEAGMHVFTELNLVPDGYNENSALAAKMNRVLFLSSTFLYRAENRYIIGRAAKQRGKLNYRYHVGQFLPDWHPWESYLDYFIGDLRTNGCRELLAIELPWLSAAFGPVTDVRVVSGRFSGLSIAYDDSYMILLRHSDGHIGSLCVDLVSRKAVRKLEVYGEELYLTWDGTPGSLYEWDVDKKESRCIDLYGSEAEHQAGYASFVVENAYSEELKAFFDLIERGTAAQYSFEDDLVTLEWIDRIERLGANQ